MAAYVYPLIVGTPMGPILCLKVAGQPPRPIANLWGAGWKWPARRGGTAPGEEEEQDEEKAGQST